MSGVLAVAFIPACVAIGLFYFLRSTKWSYLRLVAVAPLGLGAFIGFYLFQELGRPGVHEYLGIGGKKSMFYALMFILPAIAFAFLVWQDWQTRRIEFQHRSR